MNHPTLLLASGTLLACLGAPVSAQSDAVKLGDHPAVVVKRMQADAGYDYASKFYPHPAWLYLCVEAPRPMMDHPAVVVARRQAEEKRATASASCIVGGPVAPADAQVASH